MKIPEFNPTAGIPKTSYGPKSGGPTFDNATWFSTVRPSMNDPMTLVERLRNPAYHGSGLTRGKPADLDVKQTVADMAEAANEIERLRRLIDDKQYIQLKADYNKGHLSHAGWLNSREAK